MKTYFMYLLSCIILFGVTFKPTAILANDANSQKSCDTGDSRGCIRYSMQLLQQGRKPESEKTLRDLCNKKVDDGCLALAVFHKPADAEKLFGPSCLKSSKTCNDMLQILSQLRDQAFTVKLAQSGCKAGYTVACDVAKRPDQNSVIAATQGPEQIKEIEPKMTQIRKQNAKKPVDYDLQKITDAQITKEILAKTPLNKRVRFPVIQCGPFFVGSKEREWEPVIECSGGRDRQVWYKIVPDLAQSKSLPEKFGVPLQKPVWMTGTIVELRPTGVLDALVIVTD
jgi:hypothetical protein